MRASEIHQWSTHEYRPYIKTDRMDYFTQLISHNPYSKTHTYLLKTSRTLFPFHCLLYNYIGNKQANQTQKQIRSEEHTSELQSRPHLVCRLLLEKKKKK